MSRSNLFRRTCCLPSRELARVFPGRTKDRSQTALSCPNALDILGGTRLLTNALCFTLGHLRNVARTPNSFQKKNAVANGIQ